MDADLGLTTAELGPYHRELNRSHVPRWTWELLTLDGALVAALPAPADGVITVGEDTDVSRNVTGTIFDPDYSAQLDSASPLNGSRTLDRLLRIRHTLYVPELARDVVATPFYGLVTNAPRDGEQLALEGQSLERRGLYGCNVLTARAGTRVVDAIKLFLRHRVGETHFRFPANSRARLTKNVSVGPSAPPWPVCKHLAAGADYQLFYSGRWCIMQKPPTAVVGEFVWSEDPQVFGAVTSRPKLSGADALAIRNGVDTFGKGKVRGIARAHSSAANSRTNLARAGVPLDMLEAITNDAYTTNARANAVARTRLGQLMPEVGDLTFSMKPWPHLDRGDVGRLITPAYEAGYRIRSFTLPTNGDDAVVNRRTLITAPRRK